MARSRVGVELSLVVVKLNHILSVLRVGLNIRVDKIY
jgi:hypothetical protein